MAETVGIMTAFAMAVFLNANEDKLHKPMPGVTGMLNESGPHHSVIHTPLPGGDVAADIQVNCGNLLYGMKELEESISGATVTNIGTRELLRHNIASINGFIQNGATVTIQHPAVVASIESEYQRRDILPDAFYKTMGPDARMPFEFMSRIARTQYEADKMVTEEGQREIAAREDRPYVPQATISCLMM